MDTAYEAIVNRMRRKKARDTFDGALAFLWATHNKHEIKNMLKAAIIDCESV